MRVLLTPIGSAGDTLPRLLGANDVRRRCEEIARKASRTGIGAACDAIESAGRQPNRPVM